MLKRGLLKKKQGSRDQEDGDQSCFQGNAAGACFWKDFRWIARKNLNLSRVAPQPVESMNMAEKTMNSDPLSGSNCFACGPENPRGLRLVFRTEADSSMSAPWRPDATLEGYSGIIHGGMVSTVLDESMAKVVAAGGVRALTAELRVRFRRQTPSGEELRIRGWIESRSRRMIKTEAELLAADGSELAHAWAVFLPIP